MFTFSRLTRAFEESKNEKKQTKLDFSNLKHSQLCNSSSHAYQSKKLQKTYVVQYSHNGLIVNLSNLYLAFSFFHFSMPVLLQLGVNNCHTVFSRLNAALKQTLPLIFDQMPQLEAKLPINAAPNQKNAAFTRG